MENNHTVIKCDPTPPPENRLSSSSKSIIWLLFFTISVLSIYSYHDSIIKCLEEKKQKWYEMKYRKLELQREPEVKVIFKDGVQCMVKFKYKLHKDTLKNSVEELIIRNEIKKNLREEASKMTALESYNNRRSELETISNKILEELSRKNLTYESIEFMTFVYDVYFEKEMQILRVAEAEIRMQKHKLEMLKKEQEMRKIISKSRQNKNN